MFSKGQTRFAGPIILCLTAGTLPQMASATEGYFALGYSPAARGVAGAGVAYSQDAMSGAINPAAVATVGRELNLGFQAFSPSRGYTGTSTGFVPSGEVSSGKEFFPVPNAAYNLPLSNGAVVNFAAYGNGGMNTSYGNVANPNCGGGSGVFCAGEAGVDLTQLFLSVTYAQKMGRFSFGIAPTLAVQAFEAKGLGAFAAASVDATALTDNGLDYSTGVGLRVGMQYELSDQLTLGLAAQTKFNMSEFDDYAGLFEGGGDFDIPASVTVGLAYQPQSNLALLLDYQKIFYSDVPAVANSMSAGALGADGGAGFGWDDVEVIRLGAEWKSSELMTWRVGYAHTSNPVGADDVTFGILAPGVVEDHYAFGGSRQINARDRIDFSISYVPENTVSGPEMTLSGPTGGDVELNMSQISASIGWTRTF
ncbi:OmpP1/FadL family transporter [Celeribacter neptunius]|uniref:Long-chain fatty acid transport protein n=1 Tax=Celeribacter neptunius TaxID=588602 RepID=A0A1I3VHA7_9RHOB|nr:outer membrane protein transport protein [Celeribacter neptunius]SFJ94572.1 long-chain fatty acid transport protein [Celeribacter neptunius]